MPDWLMKILGDFWGVLSEMAPYLLFGFLVAGVLSIVAAPRLVERHLGGRGIWPVVKAAAFGVPLPLCSCGVIPVAAYLRRQHAGKGATTSFLIATPQTGVDSIMVTYSLLGGVYAIFRPLFALVTGIVGGMIVNVLDTDDGGIQSTNGAGDDELLAGNGHGRAYRAFAYGFGVLPRDIGRSLLVGLVIAAFISALVPKSYFAGVIRPGIWQIVVMMLVGIPVYVCATASVPLAYAMIYAGVSPGAAFAFLVTGPATNAATVATVWKVMGRRTAGIYLATMAAGAVVGGLLLDRLVTGEQVVHVHQMRHVIPPIVKHVAAIVLLGVLSPAVVRPWICRLKGKARPAAAGVELKITGMVCSQCAVTVRKVLLSCPGVTGAKVDLELGRASILGQAIDTPALCRAVEDIGYRAEPMSPR